MSLFLFPSISSSFFFQLIVVWWVDRKWSLRQWECQAKVPSLNLIHYPITDISTVRITPGRSLNIFIIMKFYRLLVTQSIFSGRMVTVDASATVLACVSLMILPCAPAHVVSDIVIGMFLLFWHERQGEIYAHGHKQASLNMQRRQIQGERMTTKP